MRRAAVAAGTGGERAQQIDLGEELDEVARPHRARLHEILVRVAREAGANQDAEHVVHVRRSASADRFQLADVSKMLQSLVELTPNTGTGGRGDMVALY